VIEPSQFIFDLATALESLLAKSRGAPAFKVGQRYYLSTNNYVDIYIAKYFKDGIYLIKDMVTAYNHVRGLLNDRYVLREYPLITKIDDYGFSIMKGLTPLPYVPMVTTNNKIAIYVSKKLYKNIDEILKHIKEINK